MADPNHTTTTETPKSTVTHVETARSGGGNSALWLILGGRDKGSDYRPLSAVLKGRARRVLLIGEAAAIIRGHLNGSTPIEEARTLERAVSFARKHAAPGDSVVLAPACASFDQFAGYAERGLKFKRLVKDLEV